MPCGVVINIGKGAFKEQALSFSKKNNIPVTDAPGDELTLVFDSGGVSLSGFGLTFRGDFENMLHRVTNGRLAHEMLVKAAKNDGENLKAIDATAGMGEDSFLLAAYGYNVTLCEQNPIIAILLKDAIHRASKNPRLKEIASRMTLQNTDSINYMSENKSSVDVIYLDPMFPARQKSGLINKKLQLIQKLEPPCSDEIDLFNAALIANPSKIIVKRPLKAPTLADRKPTFSLMGKAIRYDVYTIGNQAQSGVWSVESGVKTENATNQEKSIFKFAKLI